MINEGPSKKEWQQISRSIAYLSGAPRVSTRMDSEASGPRSHILGVIQAFLSLGYTVYPYIVGDKVPAVFQNRSRKALEGSTFIRILSDIARIAMGILHSFLAWKEFHTKVNWVYERAAVFQALGWLLQTKKRIWVIETSALYFYEASVERKSIALKCIARNIEYWAYKKCDVLVCVSKKLKDLIIDELGIDPEKIIVVPNGVDCDKFNPQGVIPVRFFENPTIGFVSALVGWHHLEVLLEVLSDLRQQEIKYNLIVIGDGPARDEWQELSIHLGLEKNVLFLGQMPWEKIPAYMAGFDLGYIGNDNMEIGLMYHSPLKLFEYMSMGLPVISTEFSDSKENIVHGTNGFLFPPGNKTKLKEVLITAFKEKNQWGVMGSNARMFVIEKASWTTRVKKMISEIENFVELDKNTC